MTYYFFPDARVDSSESSGEKVVLKVFYGPNGGFVIEPEVTIYNEDWEELSLQPLIQALEVIQEEILESEEYLEVVYEWSQNAVRAWSIRQRRVRATEACFEGAACWARVGSC